MSARRARAAEGPARWFLDTNVFVYTFDAGSPAKRERARALVAGSLKTRRGVISFQVVQEFLNVATRKFAAPLTAADCRTYLTEVLDPLCEVQSGPDLYRDALAVRERTGFAFYDSLIVAAAARAGCDRLYSEDLPHGQRVGGVLIENPFRG
jgi:predicted nucleic acid-binding protein